ncbi:MAG: TlpA family protein disulfide reductase [Bacteroidota bacterium]|jgi:thiol-disulfide isomerase/thioredoxin|nr:TlpA family protein disulfide reductase [Bacteroidota bacterium]MCA6442695.1 TlpA family protein disulfide reductase [Bacteroidota bacterium]
MSLQKSNYRLVLIIILIAQITFAQKVAGVYKINDLLNRLKNKDTTYVVNFWATWCKPCVKELPAFDSLLKQDRNLVKVILVSLDFKEDIEKKVNPFLIKNKVKCEVVVLDEVNGNDYINKISTEWTGAIPATYFKNKKKEIFAEQQVNLNELVLNLEELMKK